MFDDYFFLYTFQHVWLTKFLAADRPSRPPVHLLWSPYRSVRTYISSDTKEENLLKKKTDEKIKTGRSILTKIYANLVTIMFEEEKMRFRWRLTANKF